METTQVSKYHPSLTVDANGIVQCPDCEKKVRVGKGGLQNYDSNHFGSKQCKKDKDKVLKASKASRGTMTLGSWFTKKNPVLTVPSTVRAPALIHPTAPAPMSDDSSQAPSVTTTMLAIGPVSTIALDPSSSPNPTSPCPYALRLLNDVKQAILRLPQTVPEGCDGDILAKFAGPFPKVARDGVWEMLDPKLSSVLGWGTTAEAVATVIRRGEKGVEALHAYIEHFVSDYGIEGKLLEGKVRVLLKAMEILTIDMSDEGMLTRELPPVHTDTPNIIGLDALSETQDNEETTLPSSPDPEIVYVKTVKQSHSSHSRCPGHILVFPPGQTPHSSYPFLLHDTMNLPWTYECMQRTMILRSTSCAGGLSGGGACRTCEDLDENRNLQGIKHRIKNGVHENSPFAQHGPGGMVRALRRRGRMNDLQRVKKLNMAKKLKGREGKINEYSQMVLALSDNRIARLNRLLRTARRRKMGIHAIIALIKRAAKGTHHPKDFDEEDDLQALLMLRLAGARVADIAHRIHGSPSSSTIRRRTTVPALIPSPATPTKVEIEANIEASFSGMEKVLSSVTVDAPLHGVLMLDELATAERLRWDDRTNSFVGIGRETASRTSLEFNNEADLETIFDDLDRGEIRLASEATVGAIGLLHHNPRIYSARPILLSGTSKTEAAEAHAHLIQTTLDATESKKSVTHMRPVCVGTDGEKRRGKALVALTFKRILSILSPIFAFLGCLALMCFWVGDDDLTADKDYKHVFKRLRNTAIREKGIFVRGVHLTPAVIKRHLRDAGHTDRHITSMFKPEDKQDVVLAYNLLRDLWSIPSASSDPRPGYSDARDAIRIYGDICYHLVAPYICVDLSLSEQLEHLSSAAHLALSLYDPSDRLMPTGLYIDIMIMVKNVYFCVAKAKADHPSDPFYIILLGTDRLETLFGILRTMVGSDSNLDMLQLALRVTGTTEVANILALHPEWDKSPRRLHLPLLTRDMQSIPDAADSANPAAWRGDVIPAIVSLLTCWKRGRRAMEAKYPWTAEILKRTEGTPNASILAPRGSLLVSIPLASDDNEDEDEVSTGEHTTPSNGHEETFPEDTTDGLRELEDAITEVSLVSDTPLSMGTGHRQPISKTVHINGTPINKARALSQRFKDRKTSTSTDRLRRVENKSRYKTYIDEDDDMDDEGGGPTVAINDPIATLLYCEKKVWLAIGEVNDVFVHGKHVDEVAAALLPEKAVTISYQIVRLVRTNIEEDPSQRNDWRSSALLPSTCKTPGVLVQPINPKTSTRIPGHPFYMFDSGTLMALGASLRDRLTAPHLRAVPHIARSAEFPYRERTGEACFVVEGDEEDRDVMANICPKCGVELDFSVPQPVLAHFAAHHSHDPTIDRGEEICGTCLQPSIPGVCEYYLKKGKGANANFAVDLQKTTCVNKFKFTHKSASTSVENSPCSNAPLECKLCGPGSPAVWRYSMKAHFKLHHPLSASLPTYTALWTLSNYEKHRIYELWKTRKTKQAKRKGKGSVPLVISDTHSSRLAFRDLSEDEDDEEEEEEEPDCGGEGEEVEVDGGQRGDEEEGEGSGDIDEAGALTEDMEGGEAAQYAESAGNDEIPAFGRSMGGKQPGGETDEQDETDERSTNDREGTRLLSTEPRSHTPASSQTPTGTRLVPNPAHDTHSALGEFLNHDEATGTSLQPAIDDTPHTTGYQSMRGTRKRKTISHLADCLCGSRVNAQEIERGDQVVRCKKPGCETEWYHLECVGGFEIAPRGWMCASCAESEGGRKKRRR